MTNTTPQFFNHYYGNATISFKSDSVYQTIRWLKRCTPDPGSFSDCLANAWYDWNKFEAKDVNIEINSITYTPFERAQIFASVGPAENSTAIFEKTLYLQINVFDHAKAARAEYARCRNLAPTFPQQPPAIHLPGSHLVVWVIPNAPALCELNHVMQTDWLKSILPEVYQNEATEADNIDLKHYSPEHRAVLKWSIINESGYRNYYVNVIEDDIACASTALTLRELQSRHDSGKLSFSIPRLIRYSPAWKTLIVTEVRGCPFSELIQNLHTEMFQKIGHTLAEIHQLPVVTDNHWSIQQELGELLRHMLEVYRALPNMQTRLESAFLALENRALNLPKIDHCTIHGKMYGGQILYDEAKQKIGVIDWGHRSSGDPNFDLGQLIAYIIFTGKRDDLGETSLRPCISALINNYQQNADQPIEWARLEWHLAIALLIHAKCLSLQKLTHGWLDHFEFAVSEVEKYLRGEHIISAKHNVAQLSERSA